VCRAFADKDIEHVEGTVDPIRDLSIISDELLLKDKAMVKARHDVVKRIVEKGMDKTKKSATELAVVTKVLAHLEEGKDVRGGTWGNNEIDVLNELQCLTAKPVVYLVNISQKNFEEQKNKWLKDINEWVKKRSPGSIVIPFSCPFENYLSAIDDEEKKKDYLKEKKVMCMIPKIIKTGYAALECIYFFTSGTDEVRAWTIRKGALAPQAAGVIHTDFEKGFIACETMAFEDFKAKGTEQACKAAGRYRTEGKGYVVADGDICFFKFGTAEKAKKK
jgi:obg-like ATPase 1